MTTLKGTDFDIHDWTLTNTGPRMRAFLLHTRRTQLALAIFLGVTPTTVSRWCNGRNVPDFRTRRTIQSVIDHNVGGDL